MVGENLALGRVWVISHDKGGLGWFLVKEIFSRVLSQRGRRESLVGLRVWVDGNLVEGWCAVDLCRKYVAHNCNLQNRTISKNTSFIKRITD